jgi:DNA-binding NarL/FixJ family response regulator
VQARAQAGLVRGNLELRGGLTVTARDELLAAAERLADRDRVQAVRTLMRAGEASYLAGDHRRYLAVARDAAALRRSDDPVSTQVMLEYLDGMSATFQGRHREAAGPLRRVLELTSSVDSPSILVWATVAGLLLGEDAQALKLSGQEGLRLAEDTGQLNTAAQHLASLALVSAIQGDAETARVRSRAALKLAAAHRVGVVEARGAWALAYLDLAAGRHREAAARLRTAAWTGHGQGHLVIQVMATPQFVEAAVRIGEIAEAQAALAVFERWVSSTRSPDRLALAARCRALLTPQDEAEELYAEALDLHQQGECAFERARTQLLLGGALRRARHRRSSREHLHGALETFERLGTRSWADQARAELRASGESVRPRQHATTADLTPQQLQIARLAAAGATNREIAGRLYLSHRTVEHHLSKIFTKLEIRSRVELAKLL